MTALVISFSSMAQFLSAGGVLLAMLATGCAFNPNTSVAGASDTDMPDAAGALLDGGEALIDAAAPVVGDADPGTPDATAATFCGAGDAELVACYQFEESAGATLLADSSGYDNHAIVSGANFVTGVAGSALQGSASFDSYIASSLSLNGTAALTIEAWIRADNSVSAGRQGIFDYEGHYGFFVVAQDGLRCIAAGSSVQSANDLVKAGTWQHVACVYDASALKIYLDGTEVASAPGSGEIGITNFTGAALAGNSPSGDEFIGALDSMRIWSTARTQSELCAGAGIRCP